MKRIFIFLLLPFFANAQTNTAAAVPATEVTRLSIQYQARANWFRLMPQFNHDSTVFYFDKAVRLLEENTPVQNARLADVFKDMIKLEYRTYSFAVMDSLAGRGWFYFEEDAGSAKDLLLQYDLLSKWAAIKLEKGETKAALELFTKAIALLQNDTRPAIRAKLLKDKGSFYIRNNSLEDWQLALAPLMESLTFYKTAADPEKTEILIQLYKSITSFFDIQQKADSSFYYIEKIKSLLPQNNNPYNHAWYYAAFGRDLITPGLSKNGQDTIGEKDYEGGRTNILRAIEILDTYKLQYTSIYPYCFGLLGDIALQKRKYVQAIDYYTKTRNIELSINAKYNAIGMLLLLSKAYEEKGDLAKALLYSRQYNAESSVYEKESSERGLRENELKLDVVGKEKMITEKNAQRNLLMAFIIIAILMLLLMVFFSASLYRNYKTKGKLNNQLETLNQDLGHKNSQLDKRNAENELLLKEIHHRVKNNLEIISGLLALQAAQIDNPSAQAVMQASQNRVLSMGIIHQKLYQKGNLAAIEMKDYFHNLGESILDTFNAAATVKIICDMQPIELDVDTAVPVGLIANELLTNALKYAFEENKPGQIIIRLITADKTDELLFQVIDNGKGKPENVIAKGTGFGTELVNLLVTQLEGKLSVDATNGTTISIYFKNTKHQ